VARRKKAVVTNHRATGPRVTADHKQQVQRDSHKLLKQDRNVITVTDLRATTATGHHVITGPRDHSRHRVEKQNHNSQGKTVAVLHRSKGIKDQDLIILTSRHKGQGHQDRTGRREVRSAGIIPLRQHLMQDS
jgi:hypothetical protein